MYKTYLLTLMTCFLPILNKMLLLAHLIATTFLAVVSGFSLRQSIAPFYSHVLWNDFTVILLL